MSSAATRRAAAREWMCEPGCAGMERRVLEAIARRRRQMLVHSYIYYELDDNVISDDVWQKWATQLAKLQAKFGKRIGFYDKAFADWDGSTGFHLPRDGNVERVARRLLQDTIARTLE
jgi:oligoendopeptidase F